jgi:hypothetical protein
MMKATIAAAALVLVPVALTATAQGQADAAQLHYKNCTVLHHDFKHGVARSRKAANKQVRDGYGRPAYGTHARKVYWANRANLDRDKDGTACEA